MNNKVTIGEKITYLRKKNNLSQRNLASKLNISNKTVSKWECDLGTPDLETLKKLSNMFNLSIDSLLNENDLTYRDVNLVSKRSFFNKKNNILIICLCSIILLTLVLTIFIPRDPKLKFDDKIYNIVDDNVYIVVDNDKKNYSFEKIKSSLLCKYKIYKEVENELKPVDNLVQLEVGDNVFTLVSSNYVGKTKIYNVVIRRKPMYVINFETFGGEYIPNIEIMEGNTLGHIVPKKEGYVFAGWDYDFSKPVYNNLIISATWIKGDYVITYHSNNEKQEEYTQNVKYDTPFSIEQNIFAQKGYELIGWSLSENGNNIDYDISSTNIIYNNSFSIDLYAVWKINVYQIECIINDSLAGKINGTGNYNYKDKANLIAECNNGYSWLGWYDLNGELYSKENEIEIECIDNFKLEARFKANIYCVTLNGNGGNEKNSTAYIEFGQQFNLPVFTAYESTFIGWYYNDIKYTDETGKSIKKWDIYDNVELIAKFKLNEYKVNLKKNIENAAFIKLNEYYEYSKKVELMCDLSKGYELVGWYMEDQLISTELKCTFIMKNSDVDLYVKLKPKSYNLNLNYNDQNATIVEKNILYNSSYTLPKLEKIGYNFSGWYYMDGDKKIYVTNEYGLCLQNYSFDFDLNLYPGYKLVKYKIEYRLNGGINNNDNPIEYTVEDLDIIINYPSKSGYVFDGWIDSNLESINQDYVIPAASIGNITLAAKWIRSDEFIPIESVEDLLKIENSNGKYYLANDIDLSSCRWKSLENFYGILDGNNHTIFGYNRIDTDAQSYLKYHIGIIRNNYGLIHNLKISDSKIKYTYMTNAAILVTNNYGKILNCTLYNCEISSNKDGETIGLLCSYNGITKFANKSYVGIIENCYVDGNISGHLLKSGGVVGLNSGVITNCLSSVTFNVNQVDNKNGGIAAGIAAYNVVESDTLGNKSYGTIEKCIFNGNILESYSASGICFESGDCVISNSISLGNLVATNHIYPLVSSPNSISNCYFDSKYLEYVLDNYNGIEFDFTNVNIEKINQLINIEKFVSKNYNYIEPNAIWVVEDGKIIMKNHTND